MTLSDRQILHPIQFFLEFPPLRDFSVAAATAATAAAAMVAVSMSMADAAEKLPLLLQQLLWRRLCCQS